MTRILALVSIVLIVYRTHAQKNDPINFRQLIEKSWNAPDSARHYLTTARQYAKVPQQLLEIEQLEINLYFQQRAFDSAQWKIENVLQQYINLDELSEEAKVRLAKIHVLKGQVFRELGNYTLGTEALLEAKSILEGLEQPSIVLHEVYINIGLHFKRTNQLTEAKRWVEKSLDYALHELDNEFITETFRSYGDLGLLSQYLYQPNRALEYYELCLSMIDEYDLAGEAFYQVITHNNIAMSLESELNFDSATYHYELASSYLDNTGLTSNQIDYYRGSILGNVAFVAFKNKNFSTAIQYARKSIDILKTTYGTSHDFLIDPLRILGESTYLLGDWQQGLEHLNQALTIAEENQNTLERIKCLNALGNYFLSKIEIEQANTYFNQAQVLNRLKLTENYTYRHHAEYLYTLQGIVSGLIFNEQVDISEVEKVFEELMSTLDFVYEHFDNQTIIEAISPMLEDFYLLYVKEYDSSGNKVWLERLWQIAETNKAVKLRSQLKSEYSLSYSIPEELLTQERALKDSINQRLSMLASQAFDSALFSLNRKYEALIKRFESEFPAYYALKSSQGVVSLFQKQAALQSDELLLNFFQGQDNVYLLVVSQDQVFKTQKPYYLMNQMISTFNEVLLSGDLKGLKEASLAITQAINLNSTIFDGAEHLFIVPDGVIWKLNFGALLYSSDDTLTYFGNSYQQSYHYHADQIGVKRNPDPGNNVLAFSYNQASDEASPRSYITFRDLDQSIPGASEEVRAISNIWEGDYYFAEQANESRFKESSHDYDILHLAVHGFQNEQFPENSFLLFTEDSLNDGRLHAYELYNLNIDASLAVLTACNSGEGKVLTGEGMMSLGRAFAYAGVESLLASRWDVPDVSAPYLMRYFYEGLKAGMRKSEALQHAQQSYLENDADHITALPFYWAGFYVIGNDNPITRPSTKDNRRILMILFVGLSILFWLYFRRKSLFKIA